MTSPTDPLVLIDTTCVSYSTSIEKLRKRNDNLVPLTTSTPCFGSLISCTEGDSDNTTCAVSDTSTSKRDSACYLPPALFYNCDYFTTTLLANRNENTMTNTHFVSFIGNVYPHQATWLEVLTRYTKESARTYEIIFKRTSAPPSVQIGCS